MQLVADGVNTCHLKHQGITGFAASWTGSSKIKGQLFEAHQPQAILRTQPAQKINRPTRVGVLLEPNLLPVALICPGDGNAFTNGCVDLLEKGLQ